MATALCACNFLFYNASRRLFAWPNSVARDSVFDASYAVSAAAAADANAIAVTLFPISPYSHPPPAQSFISFYFVSFHSHRFYFRRFDGIFLITFYQIVLLLKSNWDVYTFSIRCHR